jgi:hypothetical protein
MVQLGPRKRLTQCTPLLRPQPTVTPGCAAAQATPTLTALPRLRHAYGLYLRPCFTARLRLPYGPTYGHAYGHVYSHAYGHAYGCSRPCSTALPTLKSTVTNRSNSPAAPMEHHWQPDELMLPTTLQGTQPSDGCIARRRSLRLPELPGHTSENRGGDRIAHHWRRSEVALTPPRQPRQPRLQA